jgi:hypothetical protein
METMLVGAGIVFMAGALIGGGLSAFGVTLPLFSSIRRQALLFLLGAGLLTLGAYPGLFNPVPGLDNSVDSGDTMGKLERGVNRDAHDLDNKGQYAANEYDCSELCRANGNCVAMTYVISQHTCWLKGVIPPQTPDSDMISAVKDKP